MRTLELDPQECVRMSTLLGDGVSSDLEVTWRVLLTPQDRADLASGRLTLTFEGRPLKVEGISRENLKYVVLDGTDIQTLVGWDWHVDGTLPAQAPARQEVS